MPGLNSLPKPNTPESMSSFFNYFRNFPMSNFPGMGFPLSGQQMGFPPMSFPGMGFPPMSGQQMGFPPMSFPGMGFPPMSGQQMGFPPISFPHTTGIQLTGSQNKRNNEESFSFFLILHASEAKASENYIPLPFVKKKSVNFYDINPDAFFSGWIQDPDPFFLRVDPGSRFT